VKRILDSWLLLVLFLCGGTSLVAVNVLYVLEMMKFRLASICESARLAHQRGGSEELSSMARSIELGVGIRPYLLDSAGRDLATGEDQSALLSNASAGPPIPFLPPRHGLLVERTAGGACVVAIRFQAPANRRPPPNRAGFYTSPALWFLLFLAVLCGTVAAYVTLRMHRIETVVAHFGSGGLGVRMEPQAGDPFGLLSPTFNEMADRIESLMESHKRLCLDISRQLRSPLSRLRWSARPARWIASS
jgi:methyl-accepting chemotaxis protein